ncbi:MAG: hypothetical protein KTR30_09650 [Saprospiraceae bacterium]|nr:hypothetical protein [Saprospiraceae bacterium]
MQQRHYQVKVPCDSLSNLDPFKIEIDVFKNDTMLSTDFVQKDFTLNPYTSPKNTDFSIAAADFQRACLGMYSDSLACWVDIKIYIGIITAAEADDYHLVFNLSDDVDHVHTVHSTSNRMDINRDNDSQVLNHSHATEASSCPDDPSLLAYYTCRDNSNLHIAEHIVIVPLTACPPPDQD